MEESKFTVTYMRETGLLAVSLESNGVELTIEDINEINEAVKRIGTNNIASREDFKQLT